MNTTSNEPAGIDLDKLEALARAATPGPWSVNQASAMRNGRLVVDELYVYSPDMRNVAIAADIADPNAGTMSEPNANFIAAANPAVMLELISLARSAAHAAPAAKIDVKYEFERWASDRGDSAVYIGDGLYQSGAVTDMAEAFASGVALARAASSAPVAAHAQQDAAPAGHVVDVDRNCNESIIDVALEPGTAIYLAPSAAPGKADAANAGGLPAGRRVTYVPSRGKKGVMQVTTWGPVNMVLPPHRRIIDDVLLFESATSAAGAKDAEQIPSLPEMDGPADMDYVMSTPPDWDEDYRKTWQQLQVEHRNKMQWRAYALDLRTRLAAIAASQKGGA